MQIPPNTTLWLDGSDIEQKRQQLKTYFNDTWELYESLFSLINNDKAYYQKAEPLRHPPIFYFGHTATFFINKLKLGQYIHHRLNPNFESMFAIGVDEMSWDDLDEKNYDWPQVQKVRDYRNQVKLTVNQFIDDMPLSLPITQDSPAWIILMGIEHERIHLETSSVIIRQLSLENITPSSQWAACNDVGIAPENMLQKIDAKPITLGKDYDDLTYGWDNEYGRQTFDVKNFKASKYLVSNQEFLEFVNDGGYLHPRLWCEEGKEWLAYTKADKPYFWRSKDNKWWQRNLTEEIPLPLNWPVEVNQLEANAFCHWKTEKTGLSIHLPTEAQWYILRETIAGDSTSWSETPANICLAHYASSCPVNRFEHDGLCDVIGNVWQWTQTPIDGFNDFKVHPLYDDFSVPTFDGKHNLIKGGSWISTGNEALRSARYAFRRHFFQHAGFRYVESNQNAEINTKINVYETDELISQYLEFHYGDEYFGVKNFCVNGVTQALGEIDLSSSAKALDIGCSVGRASFELAKVFNHVDAIDFSARFISQAYALVQNGCKHYTIKTEGELGEHKSIELSRLGYNKIRNQVNFVQGDACNLKPMFTGYDLIYAANLIDRLSEPKKFLSNISTRINPNGYLVITSPYTWLEEYTDKANWLGGIKVNGENQTTLDGLKDALRDQFELISVKEIPFVIRETNRKYQHSLSEMSIWRKRCKL